jgi:asparagine synthase (glutamine-hydrolysing)
MCGIVGAAGLAAPPSPETAEAILHAIEHRGPDSGGSVFTNGNWLGVRRLRILDLGERADQPARDDETGVVLVFNGEIYNFVELRDELAQLGHVFRTTGDTEVLLRGWIEWQEGLFERCNGMWALAIADRRREGVVLARDRFGEKPLYLARGPGGGFWFASELAALRRAGAWSSRLDPRRVAGFLAFGDAEDPGDAFVDGVTQLDAGSYATLTSAGLGRAERWWQLDDFVSDRWRREPAGRDEVLATIDAAVALRLRSDVEVGTSLSGGIDSSLIVSSIRRLEPDRPIHTFTASFPDTPIDEWPQAQLVAEQERTLAHRVVPTPEGFVEELRSLVAHQAGPIDSPSVYAQWCVMRAARDAGVTVLLDGQGADETWGGYPKHFWVGVGDHVTRLRPDRAAASIRTWRRLGGLPSVPGRPVLGLALPTAARPAALRASTAALSRRLGPALRGVAVTDPQGPVTGALLRRAAVADAGRVILPRLLRYADRNSMAWSRELRLPYLDPDVAGLGFSSAWRDGLTSGWTKYRLRLAAAQRLPREVVWKRGRKAAYDAPDKLWLAHPRIAEAVREARVRLAAEGLTTGDGRAFSPWRLLSLATFVDVYELSL